MASENATLLIHENPLIFMNGEYLKKELLKNKYSKGEIIEIIQNEVPIKMIIKFNNNQLAEDFYSEYNNRKLTDKMNYILKLTKSNKTEEKIKQQYSNYKKLEIFKFYMDYENEWKNNYVNDPEKSGLLYINEEGKNIGYKAIKYLIAKFTKNIMESKKILNISLPVFMFDKRTLQMGFAHEQKLGWKYRFIYRANCESSYNFKYIWKRNEWRIYNVWIFNHRCFCSCKYSNNFKVG